MRILNLLNILYQCAHAISSSCVFAVPTTAASDSSSVFVAASVMPYPASVVGFSSTPDHLTHAACAAPNADIP